MKYITSHLYMLYYGWLVYFRTSQLYQNLLGAIGFMKKNRKKNSVLNEALDKHSQIIRLSGVT